MVVEPLRPIEFPNLMSAQVPAAPPAKTLGAGCRLLSLAQPSSAEGTAFGFTYQGSYQLSSSSRAGNTKQSGNRLLSPNQLVDRSQILAPRN